MRSRYGLLTADTQIHFRVWKGVTMFWWSGRVGNMGGRDVTLAVGYDDVILDVTDTVNRLRSG